MSLSSATLIALTATLVSAAPPRGKAELRRLDRSRSAKLETDRRPRSKGPPDVLGQDDRQPVPGPGQPLPPRQGTPRADRARAFARFGTCTATHVGRGYFLTAGHCLSHEPGYRGYRNAPCPAPLVLDDGETLACTVVTFAFDAEQDHALLRLRDVDRAADLPFHPVDYGYDWTTMRRREITLYGLSGGRLRVNRSCTARYQSARKRLLHNCDTEGGDSGAAMIDRKTRYIIGVHGGALPETNYGWPIAQVPWAETLCIAMGSSARLSVTPGAAPVALRVSTSHMDGAFRRLLIDLDGRSARRDLSLKVLAPDADLEVDAQDIRWRGARWWWKDLFVLTQHDSGPWAVEVSTHPRSRRKRDYVQGKIWVCP